MNHDHKPSKDQLSRRRFFVKAGLGAAAAAAVPAIAGSCSGGQKKRKGISRFFSPGDVVLFQGDSITDAGRNRQRQLPNDAASMGTGYVYLIAAEILKELAGHELTVYNRGISGNKVYQLAERWQEDCIDLEPDVLSILIGVNDYWHMRQGRYEGTPEVYERDFRELLNRTKESLPGIRLVICEPFILTETSAVDDSWTEPFRAYREIASKLAGEFSAVRVPFQQSFNDALTLAPATHWTGDGVHPSLAGCRLMADTWLEAIS